ncbi:MAG: hypothetical protein P8Z41_14005 [Anaerolineales bacterium]
MAGRQEDHRHAVDLPEGVRPTLFDVGDVAVDHVIRVGEEDPAEHGRHVQLRPAAEHEGGAQADGAEQKQSQSGKPGEEPHSVFEEAFGSDGW